MNTIQPRPQRSLNKQKLLGTTCFTHAFIFSKRSGLWVWVPFAGPRRCHATGPGREALRESGRAPQPGQPRPISLLGFSVLRHRLTQTFREIPYVPGNSTPLTWDSAWVKPSEIQNLSTEIGRSGGKARPGQVSPSRGERRRAEERRKSYSSAPAWCRSRASRSTWGSRVLQIASSRMRGGILDMCGILQHPCTCQCAVWRQAPWTELNWTEHGILQTPRANLKKQVSSYRVGRLPGRSRGPWPDNETQRIPGASTFLFWPLKSVILWRIKTNVPDHLSWPISFGSSFSILGPSGHRTRTGGRVAWPSPAWRRGVPPGAQSLLIDARLKANNTLKQHDKLFISHIINEQDAQGSEHKFPSDGLRSPSTPNLPTTNLPTKIPWSSFPGNPLGTWEFHPVRLRFCLIQTLWNPEA